ncbi:nuclear transport factor 2 family protein [Pedobacter cryoconitis]|nr:nuclear transport factor 2 family protein [Pedobacter cryoconitis]
MSRRSKRSEVAEYLNIMWPYYEVEKSKVEIEKIFIDGDEAVILGSFSHVIASTGRHFKTPIAMHLAIADGKIYKMHLHEDTFLVDNAFNH